MIELLRVTTVAFWFPAALAYNDRSGLAEAEEQAADLWLDQFRDDRPLHFNFGDHYKFALCDITKVMYPCVSVEVFKWTAETSG